MNAPDICVDVIESPATATVSEIFIIAFLFVLDVEISPDPSRLHQICKSALKERC